MPRSFLVKSKRIHLVGQPKVSLRQHTHHKTNSNQSVTHGMWQDRRLPEDAVQSLFPMAEVKKPLPEPYTPWDGVAGQSHSTPMDVSWLSGNQLILCQGIISEWIVFVAFNCNFDLMVQI